MHRVLAALVFTLLVAPAAHADTVLSTSSFVAAAGQNVWCNVTNLGKKPITVLMEHVGIDGQILNTGSIEIFPESSDSTTYNASGLVRCRFTGKFSRKSVRAVALALDNGTALSVPAN